MKKKIIFVNLELNCTSSFFSFVKILLFIKKVNLEKNDHLIETCGNSFQLTVKCHDDLKKLVRYKYEINIFWMSWTIRSSGSNVKNIFLSKYYFNPSLALTTTFSAYVDKNIINKWLDCFALTTICFNYWRFEKFLEWHWKKQEVICFDTFKVRILWNKAPMNKL